MTPVTFKAIRKDIGLSQRDLATRLQLGINSVSRYEKGHSDIPAHVALAMTALHHRLKDLE